MSLVTRHSTPVIFFAVAATALRLTVASRGLCLLDPDESVVGLMALHIGQGRGFPVFYYGQAYLGALEAYLTAPLFLLFDSGPILLRVVPALSTGLCTWLIGTLGTRWFGFGAGVAAAAWFALAPPSVIEWTTRARGGFSEAFTLLFLLLAALDWLERKPVGRSRWLALGFLGGLAFWTNQLLAPAVLFAGVIAFKETPKNCFLKGNILASLAAFFAGSLPFWIFNTIHPLLTFQHLFLYGAGKNQILDHPSGGLRKWGIEFLWERLPKVLAPDLGGSFGPVLQGALAMSLVALAVAGMWRYGRGGAGKPSRRLAVLALLLLPGVSLELRYTVLLFPLLALIITGAFFRKGPFLPKGILLAGLMGLNLLGCRGLLTTGSAFDDITSLLRFLEKEGISHVYTDYSLGMTLPFLSREAVVASCLGRNTFWIERYPLYGLLLARKANPGYVYARGSEEATAFRHEISGQNFQYTLLGPYEVWWNLDLPPRPRP